MRVLIYVDSIKRANFFKEFSKFFEVSYITNKLSVYLKLKHLNVRLLKSHKHKLNIDYSNSLSVLNGYHTLEEAKEIGGSVVKQIEKLGSFDYFFIWNGTTTIERTLSWYARKNGIKTRYFEISNIENRVFIDKDGVLAESYLYKNPEILDKFEIDEKKFYKWREEYKTKKKQKRAIKSEIPFYAFIDSIGYKIGALREDKRNFFALFIKRMRNKHFTLPLKEPDYNKSYIFVPLQVSNDSQVKLFSKYKNEDLVKRAFELAKKNNYCVYVKPHPQEDNLEELKKLFKYESDVVKFVRGDLFELIENAKLVVVNNSTVGLEAKIFDKKTEILGEAFYKYFDKKRLISYLQNYLSQMRYPNNELDNNKIKHLMDGIDL